MDQSAATSAVEAAKAGAQPYGDASEEVPPGLRRRLGGLSARVFAITIAVVVLTELAIFIPALANQWRDSLNERLSVALVAALVRDAAPGQDIMPEVSTALLSVTGVGTIALRRSDFRELIVTDNVREMVDDRIDLRTAGFSARVMGMAKTLMRSGEGRLQVVGPVEKMPGEFIEIVLSERDVYDELVAFVKGGIGSSLLLAIVIGSVLFLVLSRSLVQPIQRLSEAMRSFSDDPENPAKTLGEWDRRDEIGDAATQLRGLQLQLQSLLGERQRLANLGSAVAKINHDLRNLFATMQLVSDTLARVDDPRVQRAAPRLVRALARGIALCETTLEYSRSGEINTQAIKQAAVPVLQEVVDQFGASAKGLTVTVEGDKDLQATFDSNHLFRIVTNLLRNASVAMGETGTVNIEVFQRVSFIHVTLTDNGPGIPDNVQRSLFEPFGKTTSEDGSGLGLAIGRELARAQGGDLLLDDTGPEGTRFRIILPA